MIKFLLELYTGGRLPVTWYPHDFVAKVPMTNMSMRPDRATGYPGRTYRFYTGKSVYPCGYGLSYTTFSHSLVHAPELVSLSLHESQLRSCYRMNNSCSSVHVENTKCEGLLLDLHMDVQNTGSRDGGHIVLLFSSPPAVHRAPQKNLVGFRKVHVGAGATERVHFSVDVCKDLSVVDEIGVKKLALGSHLLHVGDVKHSLNLQIE